MSCAALAEVGVCRWWAAAGIDPRLQDGGLAGHSLELFTFTLSFTTYLRAAACWTEPAAAEGRAFLKGVTGQPSSAGFGEPSMPRPCEPRSTQHAPPLRAKVPPVHTRSHPARRPPREGWKARMRAIHAPLRKPAEIDQRPQAHLPAPPPAEEELSASVQGRKGRAGESGVACASPKAGRVWKKRGQNAAGGESSDECRVGRSPTFYATSPRGCHAANAGRGPAGNSCGCWRENVNTLLRSLPSVLAGTFQGPDQAR